MMQAPSFCRKPLFDIVLLAIATALLFGALLGERPYSAPSESRYVEIGREMAESGNYVTPRLNYVKYFEKPPLFYWAQAAWTEIAGVDFFAARVPTAFFSVLLCLLTYALGRMLHGRLTGILSACVIATSVYLFTLSRIVLLDVPVSVFLVATLAAFLYAVNAPDGKRRSLVLYAMYAAAAGAVLTKGLIGMVLPGAVIFLWLLTTNRWNLLTRLHIPTGLVLFLALTVPWHVLVWQHNPEHPQFYFIHEHWERYTTKVHGRYHPFWFFGAVLAGGLFPWLMFAVQAVRRNTADCWQQRKENGNTLFLVIWVAFIFLFFSASDSKLIPYILPIFPPFAVWIGHYLAEWWQEEKTLPKAGVRIGVYLTLLVLLLMTAAPITLQDMLNPESKAAQAISQGGNTINHLSTATLLIAMALFYAYFQGRARHVILVLLVGAVSILQLGDLIAANYSKDSMQEFSLALRNIQKPDDEIVTYDHYYQDLPIYLGKRITVVQWKGELEFGTQHEDTSAWMIGYDEFWKRWMTPGHRMFAIMRQDAFERIKAQKPKPEEFHLYPLLQVSNNLLFTNVPPETLIEKKKP